MKRGTRRALGFLPLVILLFSRLACGQGIITTVAGSTWAFRGDGGPATNAPLGHLGGVAVDAAGNIYASDQDNSRVVKISPAGILTVVAGNGAKGFSGDGGPATSATLWGPIGVAVDAAGSVYIADFNNYRIRAVSRSGTIYTVAGNGAMGFSGDGLLSTTASLGAPYAVAADAAGNLYIADFGNNRIRKVSLSGIISTVAGNGTRGFSGDGGPATSASLAGPDGVAVDNAGNLYIADLANYRIRRVSPAGMISTVAGNGAKGFSGDGGPATSASLAGPEGVAVDAAGNLYIADPSNYCVRKVSPSGIITAVAGNGVSGFSGDGGPATSAALAYPMGVAVDAAGDLYIADASNNRVRQVSPSGTISTVAGNGAYKFAGDGGPATSASLYFPSAVAVDTAGSLLIADHANNRIRKVSPPGTITTVAGNGAVGFSGDGGPATSASLSYPAGMAVDASGNLYIADAGNNRIRRVSPDGIISTVAGNGVAGFSGDGGPATGASLNSPMGVAVDSAGSLYLADYMNNRVRKVSPSGIISTVAGDGKQAPSGCSATSTSLCYPMGVAVDTAGNLYIADTGNGRMLKVSASGTISTVLYDDGSSGTPASLQSVAVDPAGDLYIADTGNDRVRQLSPSGTLTTSAGSGLSGFSGDGGPATSARLAAPTGVAADAAGNIYIADSGNDRIRKVLAPTVQITVAGVANAASFARSPQCCVSSR
jgi:sugar lactone lactonase YvrE